MALRDGPGAASAPSPPVCLLRGCPPVSFDSPRQRQAAISAAEDVGERGSERPGTMLTLLTAMYLVVRSVSSQVSSNQPSEV